MCTNINNFNDILQGEIFKLSNQGNRCFLKLDDEIYYQSNIGWELAESDIFHMIVDGSATVIRLIVTELQDDISLTHYDANSFYYNSNAKILKEPFKPANGETYYSPEWDMKHEVIRAVESQWSGSCYEWALYMVSLTYKTKEECEEYMYKDYRRVTGSDWNANR